MTRFLLFVGLLLVSQLSWGQNCGVDFDRSIKATVEAAQAEKARTEDYPPIVLVHRGAVLRIAPDEKSPTLCVAEGEFYSTVLSMKGQVWLEGAWQHYCLVLAGERRGWVLNRDVADFGSTNLEELKTIASYSSEEIELPLVETTTSTHVGKAGETLESVAKQYGLSLQDVKTLNAPETLPESLTAGQRLKVLTPVLPRAPSLVDLNLQGYRGVPFVAENGTYYGQPSSENGRPKTVYVHGYFHKDGTYVRSYYRSRPRR